MLMLRAHAHLTFSIPASYIQMKHFAIYNSYCSRSCQAVLCAEATDVACPAQLTPAALCLIALQATLEAEKQKLVVALQELQQQQDKMRKGRFHLIAEEVEIAKQAIEKRWMEQLTEQLQQVRGQCAAEQAVGMQQWQDKVLQIIGCAAGSDVADIIRAQLLASSASE